MALRTEIIDGAIMARRTDQLVLLAPGLDARAWRLPLHRGGTAATVFEVDDAALLNLKHSCIEDPSDVRGHVHVPDWVPLSVRWVPVAGDLAHPSWPGALIEAGFDPERPSTMVLQGMWDVPTTALLGRMSSLLSPGSILAGDVPLNLLDGDMTGLLAKFGTRSASEVTSVRMTPVLPVGWSVPPLSPICSAPPPILSRTETRRTDLLNACPSLFWWQTRPWSADTPLRPPVRRACRWQSSMQC